MEFPVTLDIGPLHLHPHLVFEALAYAIGFRWFLVERRRRGDPQAGPTRATVVVAAILGAVVGGKVLVWLQDPALAWAGRGDVETWLGGKTIVGALIGGVIGVEWVKRRIGVRAATGDEFAVPMAVGIAIGRIGCLLTGVADRTHGVESTLPWAMDLGDGVLRHPTQIYEMLFLIGLAGWLVWRRRRPVARGSQWRLFLAAYLGLRLLLGFIQPGPTFAGLTAIQWACVAMLTYLANAPRLPAPTAMPADSLPTPGAETHA